jgi:hypothetical protein
MKPAFLSAQRLYGLTTQLRPRRQTVKAKRFTAEFTEPTEEKKRKEKRKGKLCSKKSSLCVLGALCGENSSGTDINP